MDFIINIHGKELDFIQACERNEKWAQKKLYEEHYSQMLGICMRYSNNKEDALDIMHDGFIKVLKNISKYQAGTSLKSWMKRIMVNTAIDFYRKRVRRRTEDLETAYDLQSYDPDVLSQISAQGILACLQELTPAYRSVFSLYVIEGYPHKEVAQMLGITESTSRSNLVKARMKLKNILAKKHISRS